MAVDPRHCFSYLIFCQPGLVLVGCDVMTPRLNAKTGHSARRGPRARGQVNWGHDTTSPWRLASWSLASYREGATNGLGCVGLS